MKLERIAFALVVAILLFYSVSYTQAGKAEKVSSSPSAAGVEAFLGRWDLTLKAPERAYPPGLECWLEEGQWQARRGGRWSEVHPLPNVALSSVHLTFY